MEHCAARYEDPEHGLEPYFETIAALREEHHRAPEKLDILDDLEKWGDGLLSV